MPKADFLVWKDEYLVGHEELDQHHRTMFKIINDLYSGMMRGASNHDLRSLFKRAVAYADIHFGREEAVLADSRYPRLGEHQQAHRAYVQQIGALTGPGPGSERAISMDMLLFLKDWWLKHILGMDRAYAPFLATAEVRDSGDSSPRRL
jgi:hemerythrin-like metal-binding protein